MKADQQLQRIRRRYVKVVRRGEHWAALLEIDHQSFYVVENTTKSRAQWFAKMLTVALARMIEAETPL